MRASDPTRATPAEDPAGLPVLHGRRLVLTGEVLAGGTGHEVARRALLAGAHLTLVAPPRDFARGRALAEELPRGAHAVRADLAREDDVAALREHLRCAYRTVDGALHVAQDASTAARELTALGRLVAPLLPPGGGSVVALSPGDDGPALSAVGAAARRLAQELAPAGARVNVVAAGQRSPRAAGAVCFLLGPRAHAVTGQVLHLGGARPPVARP